MINVADVAWAAGFIEGEGSVREKRNLSLRVTQVNAEPLEKLQRMFGGTLYTIPLRKHYQQQWQWQACGNECAACVMIIYSFMSLRWKLRIERALAMWKPKRAHLCGHYQEVAHALGL